MYALVFVGLFLVLMIVVGLWGMRKTSTLNDFFLGGRSIGPFVSALAYGTSYFSAVVFIGFAGKLGWAFGLDVLWIAIGNAVFGSMLAWLVLGHRTRIMSHNLNSMTMPEFFEARFGTPRIKIAAAMIIFVFLIPYSASVYMGLGHLFEINFNISYNSALVIMTAITGVYLVLGGYFAVTITDFIQGLIMLFGSVAMVVVLCGRMGGLSGVIDQISRNYAANMPPSARPGTLLLVSLVFMTSFGTWGLPQMIQKFYAVKNSRVIGTAALVTTVFALIVVTSAYFTGAMSHAFFTPEALPTINARPAFDQLVPELLKQNLPEILMAVILLLVLSASMSTLSSLVLVSSSAVAIDIYGKRHISERHDKKVLRLMRFLSAAFISLSLLIALYPFGVIVVLMSLSWGAVAGAFMAPYLYGLYWKRATRIGIWAGMLTGLALAVGLFFVLGPARSPIASAIAMIVPFGVVPLVSLFTRPPEAERLEQAFSGIGNP